MDKETGGNIEEPELYRTDSTKNQKTRQYPGTFLLRNIAVIMPYEPWVAVPTLVCSSLSAVATGAVILMWAFSSHDEKHSFRYALVMNLTIAGKQQGPIIPL